MTILIARRRETFQTAVLSFQWANYETAVPGTFKLMPTAKGESELRKDYTAMRPMFFSDPPAWDDILEGLRTLEQQINSAAKGQTE